MKRIGLLLLILCCFILTGCGSKEERTAKTLNDFEDICNDNGFAVTDGKVDYTEESITAARVASIDNEKIEMLIYDNSDTASKVQDGHIDSFMTIRNTMVTVDKKKGKNFYSFKMVSNGYYWVSTRIDNTLIFTKIPVDYKDNVDTILDSLGY